MSRRESVRDAVYNVFFGEIVARPDDSGGNEKAESGPPVLGRLVYTDPTPSSHMGISDVVGAAVSNVPCN